MGWQADAFGNTITVMGSLGTGDFNGDGK